MNVRCSLQFIHVLHGWRNKGEIREGGRQGGREEGTEKEKEKEKEVHRDNDRHICIHTQRYREINTDTYAHIHSDGERERGIIK